MSFIYSLTCYLCEVVGCDKTMKSMAFILWQSTDKQLREICDCWKMMLQTLEYYNDCKLWKYVYSFLYNINAYFKFFTDYVGKYTMVENPSGYKVVLRGKCMDYINKEKTDLLVEGYIKIIIKQFGITIPHVIIPIIQSYHIIE